jgi:hypothetical protein
VSDAVPFQGVSAGAFHGVSDGAAQGVSDEVAVAVQGVSVGVVVLHGVSEAVAVQGVSAGAAWAVVAARTGRRTAAAIAVRAERIRTVVSFRSWADDFLRYLPHRR